MRPARGDWSNVYKDDADATTRLYARGRFLPSAESDKLLLVF